LRAHHLDRRLEDPLPGARFGRDLERLQQRLAGRKVAVEARAGDARGGGKLDDGRLAAPGEDRGGLLEESVFDRDLLRLSETACLVKSHVR